MEYNPFNCKSNLFLIFINSIEHDQSMQNRDTFQTNLIFSHFTLSLKNIENYKASNNKAI